MSHYEIRYGYTYVGQPECGAYRAPTSLAGHSSAYPSPPVIIDMSDRPSGRDHMGSQPAAADHMGSGLVGADVVLFKS